MKAYNFSMKCLFKSADSPSVALAFMSARRVRGGRHFLLSRMFSVDWLDNFDASHVCISATKVSEFVGDLFSFFMTIKQLKMCCAFLLSLANTNFFIRTSKIEVQAGCSQAVRMDYS